MKINSIYLIIVFTTLLLGGCKDEVIQGPPGPAGQDGLDTEVYYSEWFSPTEWSGESGDWYFEASAPDLKEDIVEGGLIMAYVWLSDDIYEGMAVRPLPTYAVGANWDFLIPDYGAIVFNCDMVTRPLSAENKFRFIAIPGNIPALKSASSRTKRVQELRSMTYQEVCKLFNIPQ